MPKGTEYELAVKIAGKVDASFKNATKTAKSSLSGLASAAKGAFKGIAVGAAAVATATAAVGAAAVKSAMEYESQLANISTLLTGTEEEVAARTKEIGEQVLEVSNRTGVSTDDLTDGMYQVVSAFGDTADAAAQLEVAAKAAAAGNATTTDSINLLSAVTKGYGDTSAEAVQKAADLSFATVRLGQTSFPELAASMGKVIPLASTLGVEQEQLFGAMATLTGVTGSTSEVVTQLKATMQGFLSPTKEMQAALSSLGYESGQALLESEGLQGALESLKGTVGGDELAFAKLFSSVEAQTAVLAMAGTQADNLTQKTAEMYEATGAADTAFQRQTDTLAYTIQSFKNLGKNMLTQVGTAMLPAVQRIMDAVVEMEPTISTVFTLMSDAIVSMVPVNADTLLHGAEASEIAFVVLAENGAIDAVTAGEHADIFLPWQSGIAYTAGNLRQYGGKLYKCVQAHTSQEGWEPDKVASLWTLTHDPAEEWPNWSAPIGAQDAYQQGAKVTHSEKHWTSDIDSNVWEPGVYGWTEAQDE